jgi:ABC-type transport system substrate-binding protein
VVGNGPGAVDPEQARRSRMLRQALAIAIDWEEYSKIFPKKAGETAMSPLPPGIFGSREGTKAGLNPYTHRWEGDEKTGRPVRRPIEDAKRLMVEAGYPNGRDAKSGKPLVLNYDVYFPATPERKPEIDWVVRQFAKIDIQLEVRATDNNQFQDKVRKGKYQVFWLGWNADYPDAENFLFLMYGKAGKTKYDGENTSNYENPEYDRLFERMKSLDDGPEKQELIDQMVAMVREDAPWTMGFFPYTSVAIQSWVLNNKPAILIRDQARYLRLDVDRRVAALAAWNRPIWWPVALLVLGALSLVFGARWVLARRERMNARGEVLAGAD